jgi:hypothetical protein
MGANNKTDRGKVQQCESSAMWAMINVEVDLWLSITETITFLGSDVRTNHRLSQILCCGSTIKTNSANISM